MCCFSFANKRFNFDSFARTQSFSGRAEMIGDKVNEQKIRQKMNENELPARWHTV